MEKLPIYEAIIDNMDDGMYTVSLVDYPAVESDFLYFKKDQKTLNFKVENEEKRVVTGVLMRADHPIYRIGTSGYEYYIKFSKETIEKMVEKWLENGLTNNVNLMHNPENYVKNVHLREVFIKNVDRGVNPKGFESIEDGSLFGTYYVENDDVWQSIKNGEFKGFSIECLMSSYEVKMEDDKQLLSDILDLLKKIENKRK
jgi:hypothetical protein